FNFLSLGERLPSESLRSTAEELKALKDIRALGFTVAWRDSHPSAPLPQTLRWSRNQETPYHCDGFLVRGAEIVSCEVIAAPEILAVSDHNPVLLEIQAPEFS